MKINILTELAELDASLDGQEDVTNEGGPNDAMRVRQLLALALPRLSALIEAAQFVLDKEWEYGEEQTAFASLNAAITNVRAGSEI